MALARARRSHPMSTKMISARAQDDYISLVVPTYNRAAALRACLPGMLAIEGVDEAVVVDDGSIDETPEVLAAVIDPRLRIVRLARNGGVAAARNAGAEAATSPWILYGEDDCEFPPDYALVLLEEARLHEADLIGAPFVGLRNYEERDAVVARLRAVGATRKAMDDDDVFPRRTMETPWLPARMLVRRAVVLALRYDEDYRGNAYREETDFAVRAARAGLRCVLTPRTYSFQVVQHGGGNRLHRASYEWWTARNNWRFLRRHGAWLRLRGEIDSPSGEQLRFIGRRFEANARGWIGARLGR
jgi:glycosyltransferase involved in cell wall biosynthesis